MFTPTNCLLLSVILFTIGIYGVLARKNLIIILISIELMLNAVNLALMTFSRWRGITKSSILPEEFLWGTQGHIFVLMIMAVAAAEAAVGLALLIALFKHKKSVDSDRINLMKG